MVSLLPKRKTISGPKPPKPGQGKAQQALMKMLLEMKPELQPYLGFLTPYLPGEDELRQAAEEMRNQSGPIWDMVMAMSSEIADESI